MAGPRRAPPGDAASFDAVTDRVEGEQGPTGADEPEIVDAVPVPEGAPAHEPPSTPAVAPRAGMVQASPVAVQAAAVAVTGFAAGAATVAVVRRRRARKALGRRKDRKALADVRATRSFLVDIHLLNRDA
jgi:hypothetical protein